MLPEPNRLKKRKDFARIFREGKTFNGDFFLIKILKNNLRVSRFGFVISKKISAKATTRNRIKRSMRELIRLKLPEIKKGQDMIFIVKQKPNNLKKLEDAIYRYLKRARILI